jgi:hypothetical protein
VTFRASDRDLQLLRLAANRAGLSQADVLHIAIEEYAEKRNLRLPDDPPAQG